VCAAALSGCCGVWVVWTGIFGVGIPNCAIGTEGEDGVGLGRKYECGV